jgi:hypothetical protein
MPTARDTVRFIPLLIVFLARSAWAGPALSVSAMGLVEMFWQFPFGLALLLGLLGWNARGRLRLALLILAGIAMIPVAGALQNAIELQREISRAAAERERLNTTLTAPLALSGVTFPRGTRISWLDAAHTQLDRAEFLTETEIGGLPFIAWFSIGDPHSKWPRFFENDQRLTWRGTLARPIERDGWRCEDEIAVSFDFHLRECIVAAETIFHGLTIPRSSVVLFDQDGWVRAILLPREGRGASIAGSDITLPPTAEITWYRSGAIESAHALRPDERETGIRVGPVEFNATAVWIYPPGSDLSGGGAPPVAIAVRGEPAHEHTTNSEAVAKLGLVEVGLTTGAVRAIASP